MKLNIGRMQHGPRNLITDVPGVTVGHCTVDHDDTHTGVTVVLPSPANPFTEKLTAASFVFNGFGKTQGLVQVDELGTLETPIALTNTLNVGLVHDALVGYMVERCAQDGFRLTSVNPVVCECNDSRINRIEERAIREEHVRAAIADAGSDFAQGAVGAGRGTICYGMKGGIGSASRQFTIGKETFTVGVLVQSNYGASGDFRLTELPESLAECDKGSIIIIVATDLPLSCRQLRRVIKRASVGMARLGSYIGHGSGEIVVGFTTARPVAQDDGFVTARCLQEKQINIPFRAVGEATEEAILQSMLHAEGHTLPDGEHIPSLREFMEKP